jgi:hypothetical protein
MFGNPVTDGQPLVHAFFTKGDEAAGYALRQALRKSSQAAGDLEDLLLKLTPGGVANHHDAEEILHGAKPLGYLALQDVLAALAEEDIQIPLHKLLGLPRPISAVALKSPASMAATAALKRGRGKRETLVPVQAGGEETPNGETVAPLPEPVASDVSTPPVATPPETEAPVEDSASTATAGDGSLAAILAASIARSELSEKLAVVQAQLATCQRELTASQKTAAAQEETLGQLRAEMVVIGQQRDEAVAAVALMQGELASSCEEVRTLTASRRKDAKALEKAQADLAAAQEALKAKPKVVVSEKVATPVRVSAPPPAAEEKPPRRWAYAYPGGVPFRARQR